MGRRRFDAHREAGTFAESGLAMKDVGYDLIGREIGAYRILSLLGAGGMGEVYRARDTKLGRDVAIKILPSTFTHDAERRARFEREARVLAALNHPHIGAIHGLEQADGVQALVLELVEGETLAERLTRGPLSISDGLAIGRQIADALEAAHEKGIVHRDLKPANIKITPNGNVKVLDFGLAKATGPNLPDLPTITVDATQEGSILGTAAYMSPEQARGQPVDRRTDVWAFGCVLYEMLSGRAAFARATFPDTVAAIVEREPDWSALPASTSPHLRHLLRRCVVKNPKMRLQAIGDARVQIEELISGAAVETIAAGSTQPHAQRSARFATIVAGILLVIAAALAVPTTLYFRRTVADPPTTRFEISTPTTSDLVSFALSADGQQLAFVATTEGTSRLWVRPLDQVTAQPLPDTEGARYPFWKPDGREIGFFADGKLKRIALGSVNSSLVADAPNGRGGTWNQDGVIVFAPAGFGVLLSVKVPGGTPVPVTRLPSSVGSHRFPQFLPDGRRFLYLGGTGAGLGRDMFVGSLDGTESKRVRSATSVAVYAAPASLLWVEEGVLVAQPFDPARAVVTGEPIPVVQNVGLDEAVYRGMFAVSATGVLAHRTGQGQRRQLTWIDRDGIARGTVGAPDDSGLSGVELSPDGKRVAVTRAVESNSDVWLIDTDGGDFQRLTFEPGLDHSPVWSSDGTRFVFGSPRNGPANLFEKAASGAGNEKLLLVSDQPKLALDWSRDGQWLLYNTLHPKTGLDIWAVPMPPDRKPVAVMDTPFDETGAQFSPNGRWVTYQSNESKPARIYIRPFPGPGGTVQVPGTGGSQPRWSRDGKELFYLGLDGRLMAVPIATGADGQLQPGSAVALFRPQLAGGPNINTSGLGTKAQYAVGPDGRFLMNISLEAATATPITVVLNWDAALKK
jgi:Tol biopolymer transport system component